MRVTRDDAGLGMLPRLLFQRRRMPRRRQHAKGSPQSRCSGSPAVCRCRRAVCRWRLVSQPASEPVAVDEAPRGRSSVLEQRAP